MRKESYVRPVDPDPRRKARGESRRPISEDEARALEAFGAALRMARKAAGLTQAELGLAAGYGKSWVYRLEAAVRRPRLSGIEALVAVIVRRSPVLGNGEALTRDLIRLAGIALAPESEYRERVERRRAKRVEDRRRDAERTKAIRLRVFARMREEAHREHQEAAEAKRRRSEGGSGKSGTKKSR